MSSLSIVDWGMSLEKQRMEEAKNAIKDAVQQAQLMAITKHQNQKLNATENSIWISNSSPPSNKFLFEKVTDDITFQTTDNLIFTPYGFSRAGSIKIVSPSYSTKIVINSMGGSRSEKTIKNRP